MSSLEDSNYGRAKTVPKMRIASWSVGSFKRRRFAEAGRVNNERGRHSESSDSDASYGVTDDLQINQLIRAQETVNSALIHCADRSMRQDSSGLTNRGDEC